MAKSAIIKSSLVKKYWMSLTGLFLCLFLVGHLAGNLQLLINPVSDGTIENIAKEKFNAYALFMTTNPLVKILSYVTYFSILFHAIDGILLVVQNRKARPKKYAYSKPGRSSTWTSRSMGVLGTAILIFIVIHMSNFWYEMHFNLTPTYELDNGKVVKDLYKNVVMAFQGNPEIEGSRATSLIYVVGYVISMLILAFHLSHGFQSAFQSIGLKNNKYKAIISKAGLAFSIIVPLLFALIPILMFLGVHPL